MVILKTSVCMQKAVLKSNNLQYNLVGWLDDGIWLSGCLFVCNRGGTYYSIMAGSRQGSLAKPLPLLFLTPRPTLSSHQHSPLVCLFWSGNLHCAHSPANLTVARQECFELLDVSNSSNCQISLDLTVIEAWEKR